MNWLVAAPSSLLAPPTRLKRNSMCREAIVIGWFRDHRGKVREGGVVYLINSLVPGLPAVTKVVDLLPCCYMYISMITVYQLHCEYC